MINLTTQQKGNLVLSGNGETAGGIFDKVVINGSGKVNGHIECNDFQCNGSARVNGNIASQRAIINGSTKVVGNIVSERMEIHGHSTIEGTVNFEKLEINGHAKIRNSVKGEKLSLEGMVKVEGDCEVEEAYLKGVFTINGLLNADMISIQLHGRSSVKEIGGEKVTVKRENGVLSILEKLLKPFSKELQVELIEGDVLNLEYTKANTVRGNQIVIGPGCEIGVVEYSGDLHISNDAIVKEKVQI